MSFTTLAEESQVTDDVKTGGGKKRRKNTRKSRKNTKKTRKNTRKRRKNNKRKK
jgi:hypothetical protein